MPRTLLAALAAAFVAALLTASVAEAGSSRAHVRGTVLTKSQSRHVVAVKSARLRFSLRVPGSLASIRVGEQVELLGTTLRSADRGRSQVLARGVSVLGSQPASGSQSPAQSSSGDRNELEITGKLTALSPLTVVAGTRTASCAAPAGMSLAGFAVGDVVEMKCVLVAGAWTVRELQREDVAEEEHATADDDENDDQSTAADDDHDHNGGPGSGDDGNEGDD
jgi:hypothetical protein